jgi:hypothetical protein
MEQLAVLGGAAARTSASPEWPIFDDLEKDALLSVVTSGDWGRLGGDVTQ